MIYTPIMTRVGLKQRHLDAGWSVTNRCLRHYRRREQQMTSKTFQIKLIRKNKKRAHKANRKVDQKRIERNQELSIKRISCCMPKKRKGRLFIGCPFFYNMTITLTNL